MIPSKVKTAFVDSGTTFAYMSPGQKAQIDRAITKLCEDGEYNWLGKKHGKNW